MEFLKASPGYLIYFDGLRIDPFVLSYSVDSVLAPSAPMATLQMLPIKELRQIDGYTDVKIFERNVFNGAYNLVFDGQIVKRSGLRSPRQIGSLVFTAQGYLSWLSSAPNPIVTLTGTTDLQTSNPQLFWEYVAQAVNLQKVGVIPRDGVNLDLSNLDVMTAVSEIIYRARTISGEFTDQSTGQVIDADSVAAWSRLGSRTTVMADAKPSAVQGANYTWAGSATFAIRTALDLLVTYVAHYGLELYQDGDGMIRIKRPYWADDILKSHVIPGQMISEWADQADWTNFVTRTLVVGSFMRGADPSQGGQATLQSLTAPIGIFLAGRGFVYPQVATPSSQPQGAAPPTNANGIATPVPSAYVPPGSPTAKGSAPDVGILTDLANNPGLLSTPYHVPGPWQAGYHTGIDVAYSSGTPIYNQGPGGTVTFAGPGGLSQFGNDPAPGDAYGNVVVVRQNWQPTTWCLYAHMLALPAVNAGEQVAPGQLLGYVGETGDASGPHLHFEVRQGADLYGKDVNPTAWLQQVQTSAAGTSVAAAGSSTQASSAITSSGVPIPGSSGFVQTLGLEASAYDQTGNPVDIEPTLLSLSDEERRYGVKLYQTDDELIYANNTQNGVDITRRLLSQYAAYIYQLINYQSAPESITTQVAMPWLRLGFNVWLDPSGDSIVGYIASLHRQGDPGNGSSTQIGIVRAREQSTYAAEVANHASSPDDFFSSSSLVDSWSFGPTVHYSDMPAMASKIEGIEAAPPSVVTAAQSRLRELYDNPVPQWTPAPKPGTTAQQLLDTDISPFTTVQWSGDLSRGEIETQLNGGYDNFAPPVVQRRRYALYQLLQAAIPKMLTFWRSREIDAGSFNLPSVKPGPASPATVAAPAPTGGTPGLPGS